MRARETVVRFRRQIGRHMTMLRTRSTTSAGQNRSRKIPYLDFSSELTESSHFILEIGMLVPEFIQLKRWSLFCNDTQTYSVLPEQAIVPKIAHEFCSFLKARIPSDLNARHDDQWLKLKKKNCSIPRLHSAPKAHWQTFGRGQLVNHSWGVSPETLFENYHQPKFSLTSPNIWLESLFILVAYSVLLRAVRE